MPPIDTDWFTDALANRKMSQRKLARLLGCDPASIYRLLKGKRPMRLDEATAIATLLGTPVTEILDHAGVPVRTDDSVPVVGWIDGIGEAHLTLDADTEDIRGGERVPGLTGTPPGTCALRAQTSGSPMQHVDGWLYYVEMPLRAGVPADALERYCLVELPTGTRLLRWVRRGYQRGTWNLEAHTSPAIANAQLVAATPILGIRTI